MSEYTPLYASLPSAGPLYTAITSTWSGLGLPKPPVELVTWVPGQSPISTNKEVVICIVTYLLVIFGGRELMRSRAPFKLTALFQLHNLILTSGSLVLLLLMLEEIIPMYFKQGFLFSICNTKAFTARLVTYYMINYYIKYVELIDTVFLVLKKKPLAFLHVFHHAATAVLCYTQLEGETSVQWVVISLNLTVHVIMYYYYYATAGGARIWWKKYLTTLQITQFVIDLFIVFFATYSHFAYKYNLPNIGDCAGSEGAALFGCGLLSSYLFLFIAFYKATYKKTGAKGKSAQVAAEQVANGSGPAAGTRGSAKSK